MSSELPVESFCASGAWWAAGRGTTRAGAAALHGLCGAPPLLSDESRKARGCITSQHCSHLQAISITFEWWGNRASVCPRHCSLTPLFVYALTTLFFVVLSDFWWQKAHWRETGGKSETQGAPQWSRSSDGYRKLAGPWTLVLSEVWILCLKVVWPGLDRATDKLCFSNVFVVIDLIT